MLRIGINGFGRIGRAVTRLALENNDLVVGAINTRSNTDTIAYLLKYDSTHGTLPYDIKHNKESIYVKDKKIVCYKYNSPSDIPWEKEKVDIVIESTGVFKSKSEASAHLGKTVNKVIIAAPSEDADKTIVIGVNETEYDSAKHNIISNASCTTNCLAPVCKVLLENFGLNYGFMTTTHSITSSQSLLDRSHKKSKRLGRAAQSSIIPTTTGASKALRLVIPELDNNISAISLRVPTQNVSLIDLCVNMDNSPSVEEINNAFKKYASDELNGILKALDEEIVSTDINGMKYSAIIDPFLTQTKNNSAKVFAWYDNEIGYSARIIDLAKYIGNKL